MSRRDRKLQRRNIMKKRDSTSHHKHSIRSDEGGTSKGNFIVNLYENKYKALMLIPIIMLILSFAVIGINYAKTGDFMPLGVSIKGGVAVTVPNVDKTAAETSDFLSQEFANIPNADFSTREIKSRTFTSVAIEASGVEQEELTNKLEEFFEKNSDEFTTEVTGSTLGSNFFRQSIKALIIAFIIMGFVVFISFRTVVPSGAVILSAVFDMVVTIAIVNLLGIKVSTAGLAAFLMLIGYSVDTDILLTSKVLRGKGSIMSRIYDAMKTGMTMSLTTIGAIIVAIIFSKSAVLTQIMTILLIGLAVDLISTWLQNTAILRMYTAKKERASVQQNN